MTQRPRLRSLHDFANSVLLLLFIASLSNSAAQSILCDCLPTRSSLEHIYRVDVSSRYGNTSTHFAGIQLLKLEGLNQDTLTGRLTWNLSWDEGATWLVANAAYNYATNRSYKTQNVTLYTAWWIDSAVQLGDRILIHGDPPATNCFLRNGPFLVTDVVSLWIDSGRYACWLLTYETPGGQQEQFYYELWTGLLVAAYSSQMNPSMQSRQMRLELQTATPPLPPEDLLTHLWLSFGPPLLSLAIAILAAVGTYRLLLRIREHPFRKWLGKDAKHNA